MLAFNRLSSFLFLVLSLSLVVCAHPGISPRSPDLGAWFDPSKAQGEALTKLIAGLKSDVSNTAKDISVAKSEADASANVNGLILKIGSLAGAVPTRADLSASDKTDLAGNLGSIITTIVGIGSSISTQSTATSQLPRLDIFSSALLVTVNGSVPNILDLVSPIVAKIGVPTLQNLNFNFTLTVLGLASSK
ncbi:hypothetical protein CTheo_8450 [Ceratobasidium theobromae]|uniref:Transmembrane protein n=1 Tax=Ceratobasidium theobromae TaxID=1582974 RepID=A0A5N5Q9K1_9AGAM|nr:hypothetical protein CTheo_8450 [Ceratobasidium theobromae]